MHFCNGLDLNRENLAYSLWLKLRTTKLARNELA